MPLLTTIPMRISTPMLAMRLKGVPVKARNQLAPTREKGIEKRMAKGWLTDSKSEAMRT